MEKQKVEQVVISTYAHKQLKQIAKARVRGNHQVKTYKGIVEVMIDELYKDEVVK